MSDAESAVLIAKLRRYVERFEELSGFQNEDLVKVLRGADQLIARQAAVIARVEALADSLEESADMLGGRERRIYDDCSDKIRAALGEQNDH